MVESNADGHVASLEEIKGYSGIEFLRRIATGAVPQPPITKPWGFASRRSRLVSRSSRWLRRSGTTIRSAACMAAWRRRCSNSCMSCSIQTHLEKGLGYTTLELKVNLVRPMTEETGPIRAEGRSLYVGRRSATAEGKIIDANGTLLAHGTTTCLIFPL